MYREEGLWLLLIAALVRCERQRHHPLQRRAQERLHGPEKRNIRSGNERNQALLYYEVFCYSPMLLWCAEGQFIVWLCVVAISCFCHVLIHNSFYHFAMS